MSKFSKSNNRAIVLPYTILVIIVALFFGLFVNRRYHFVMYIALGLSTVAYIFFIRAKVSTTVEVLFMRGDIDEIMDYYRRTIKMVPRRRFWISYVNSIAFSLFGKFSQAETEIGKMDTGRLSPMYEGMRQNAKAIIYYLKRSDCEEGLLCSRRAKELSALGKIVPGQKTAQNTYDAYVEIGLILTGKADDKTVAKLRERFGTSLFLLKLPVAWALARHHKDKDPELFKVYDDFLKKSAPSCKPLRE